MSRLTLIFILSLFTIKVCGQTKLAGAYQTNFPAYGMFGETLTLNCDSTVILNFRGDLMNDNSFGTWTTNKTELILTFDSTLHPDQRYKGQMNYRIKGNRLYVLTITKKQYQDLKEKADQYSKENNSDLKVPTSYKKFKRKYGKTMKNSTDKARVQYFKKIKSSDCEQTNNR
jgi:hypothetical protein